MWLSLSIRIAILVLSVGAQIPTTTSGLPPGVKSLRVNGYDMAYVERGKGQPVLLVPGTLSDFRYFADVMDPLSSKYRVIAVSLRHYYPGRWNGVAAISRCDSTLQTSPRSSGSSMRGPCISWASRLGASLAMYVASTNGQLVRTLGLAEPNMRAFDDDPQRVKQLFDKSQAMIERGNVDGALEYFIDYVNGPGSWKAVPEAGRQRFRANASTLAGEAKDEWHPYTCADAGRIEVPVLLIAGEKSPPFFGKILDAIQACLKRSERVVIANASHGMPRQNPVGFSEAVLTFISKDEDKTRGVGARMR